MKETETLQPQGPEINEQKERSPDEIFDTTYVEMGHYALLSELYATENRLEELATSTSESRDKEKDDFDSQEGGPQATRNRMVGLQFQAERTAREVAMLEQTKQGIEEVFAQPISIEYTPTRTDIEVTHIGPSEADYFERAA